MKIFRKLTVIFTAIAMLCGSAPLAAFATPPPFDFDFAQNYSNMAVSDSVQLYPTSTTSGIAYSYTSLDTSIATVSATGRVTARKAGTAQIMVAGILGADQVTKTLNIQILEKLKVSSNTSLEKRLGDPQFIFHVSFNVKKSDVTYSFSIYDEDIATIDATTGRVSIKAVGETTILVEAFANGYQDAFTEFTLLVGERESASGNSGEDGIVLNGGDTGARTGIGTAGTGTTTAAAANPYKDFKFTGTISVNGKSFSLTNNLSSGTKFAVKTENNDGDWWRSPEAFTGSRGIYTAKSEGVSELIYADTEGKTYPFKINSYKLVKYSNFMIPERIPVGAVFSVPAPTDKPGIWSKSSTMLSGARGTYIPLKAGKTTLSYTTKDLKYTVTITIVDDTPPAAQPDASGTTSGSAGVNGANAGNGGNGAAIATGVGNPSSEIPLPPSIIILN